MEQVDQRLLHYGQMVGPRHMPVSDESRVHDAGTGCIWWGQLAECEAGWSKEQGIHCRASRLLLGCEGRAAAFGTYGHFVSKKMTERRRLMLIACSCLHAHRETATACMERYWRPEVVMQAGLVNSVNGQVPSQASRTPAGGRKMSQEYVRKRGAGRQLRGRG